MRKLELRIPPVAIGLILAALMWLAGRFLPWSGLPLPGRSAIAIGLASAGALVAIAGVVSFRRARTTVNPFQPAAASQLVVSGIYRWTRNPMYLGMLLLLVGWGVFLASLPALAIAAAWVPLMNRLQIIPEERALTANFGLAFTSYQARVRRWL